jgi:LmbE family N-acetylglucosaminyl deacetylase
MRRYARQLYRMLYPRLYSRQDLKLLLGASLGQLDERLLVLAAEADQFQGSVRAIPVKAPFGESMLVVAPHQDDEAIGCGGVLLLQRRAGKPVAVVMMHDGGDEFADAGMSRDELVALRNAETEEAARVAGIGPVRFLGHSRLERAAEEIVAALADEIRKRKVDVVVSPFPLDGHPDHRTAARFVAEALRGIEWPVRVMTYEVWGLCIPNVAVVVDEVMEQKRAMLECFRWANAAVDYTNTTTGLNMYRARQLPAGTARYVECYFELPKAEYIEMMDRLKKGNATG